MWQLNERRRRSSTTFSKQHHGSDHARPRTDRDHGRADEGGATGNPLVIDLRRRKASCGTSKTCTRAGGRPQEWSSRLASRAKRWSGANAQRAGTTAKAIAPTNEGGAAAVINKSRSGHGDCAGHPGRGESRRKTKASPGYWSSYKAAVPLATFRGLSVTPEGATMGRMWCSASADTPRATGQNNEDNDYARVKVNLLVADPRCRRAGWPSRRR